MTELPRELNHPKRLFEILHPIASVSKVLVMTNLNQALVEFLDIECAHRALEKFNQMALFDSKIDITFSTYHSLIHDGNSRDRRARRFNRIFVNHDPREQYFQHETHLKFKGIKIDFELNEEH